MMNQITKQIPAYRVEGGTSTGRRLNVADQINELLGENQNLKFMNVHPLPLSKIGGVDYEFLVVFEARTPNQLTQAARDVVEQWQRIAIKDDTLGVHALRTMISKLDFLAWQ